MTTQSELIALNEQVAGAQARIKFMFDDADEMTAADQVRQVTAIKSANAELPALIDRRDALQREVAAQQADQDALKALRYPTNRQAVDDWPRADAAGDWSRAVIDAAETIAGSRGTKSLITSGSATVATAVGGPIEDPRRARFLRELMPSLDAEGGHYAYLRQTVRENNAAVVAPAAVKPESVYTLVRVDGTTDVVAHITEPISRQDLEDAAVLRQFIDQELRLGLELAIDAEIVGAIDAAGPLVEGDIGTTLDTTRRCITRLQEREIEPSAFLLHPRDWEQIENEAQTTFAANANMAPATDAVKRMLWGVPVFLSNALTQNTGYLGDFSNSSALYRTGGVLIDWSEGHYDTGIGATDFERNLVRFRAETRVGVAILRSFAFVEIDLAGTGS
jgi:HK97 family phage major capsid protein